MKQPYVSILIVNFNGRVLLDKCLQSLQKITYPKNAFEVIVVDNHSNDGSCDFVRKSFPWVKLVPADENLGFTGGNNLALEHAKGELIVLLNNDTQVDPDWLTALVDAAEDNPSVGLFSSRLRFATPYICLNIKTKAIQKSEVEESIDFSPIGVMIENITCKEKNHNDLIWYGDGFYRSIPGAVTARWTKGRAQVFLPFPIQSWEENGTAQYTLTLHGYDTDQQLDAPIELSWGDSKPFYVGKLAPQSVKQIKLIAKCTDVKKQTNWFVQNAGNVLLHDGYSKDRGSLIRIDGNEKREFYELESPYYLEPKILTAVCGASCMVRKSVIDEIQFLDGHYFMYYEDVEFSVRAWKAGWDAMYVPNSLVYHHHKATTSLTSQVFFMHMAERNHLFFTYTHYPITTFIKQFIFFMLRFQLSALKYIASFLKEDSVRYEKWRTHTAARKHALQDFIKHFPHLTANKWFWHTRSKRPFSELERMMY